MRIGFESRGQQRKAMVQELRKYRAEFMSCGFLPDFEKEWIGRHV